MLFEIKLFKNTVFYCNRSSSTVTNDAIEQQRYRVIFDDAQKAGTKANIKNKM